MLPIFNISINQSIKQLTEKKIYISEWVMPYNLTGSSHYHAIVDFHQFGILLIKKKKTGEEYNNKVQDN